MKITLLNIMPSNLKYDHPMVQDVMIVFEEVTMNAGGAIVSLEYDNGSFHIEVTSEDAGKALQDFREKMMLTKAVFMPDNTTPPTE